MSQFRFALALLPFFVVHSSITARAAAPQTEPAGPVVADDGSAPVRALVIGGASNHDWRFTTPALRDLLRSFDRFEVDSTNRPAETLADAAAVARYDVFVLDYNGPRWGEPAESNFLAAVRGGAGVAVVHAANNSFPGWVEYEKLTGLGWRDGTGHGRFHPFDVEIVDHYHPITRGLPRMRLHPDELYHHLEHLHDVPLRVLMSAYSDPEHGGSGRFEPMALVLEYGRGRVFHTPLGHVWVGVPASRASIADPQFQLLLARGAEWAATGAVTLPDRPLNWLSPEERDAGFMLLFDGRRADGWRGYRRSGMPETGWVAEAGALKHVGGAGGGDLITVDTFGDFDLRFEWKVAERANSGVIYRVTEDHDTTWQTGPEYQVLDDVGHGFAPDSLHGAGGLYELATSAQKVVRPVGQYNDARIVVEGWRVRHWLNGVLVADLDLESDAGKAKIAASKFGSMPGFAKNRVGHIALQDHGDTVWYRSLRIRNLPGD